MIKNEYKEKVKGFKEGLKSVKKAYKADRPPLLERIRIIYKKVIVQIKYWIKIVKIVYKSVFHAWIRIQELKKENNKLQDEIEEWKKVEE